jgi:acyl-CoA reductase-like NAD-dependent aldehyde dehydrogenase
VTGVFFEPTVLVDVDQSMSCMREETFGPTLPVMKVQDVDEAIGLANDSSYGLSASVWTGDRGRGEPIARRLEVGAVYVNDMFANVVTLPVPQGAGRSRASAPASVAHTGFASTAARRQSPRPD